MWQTSVMAMFPAELSNLQLWEQMLEMHTSKHSQQKSCTLYLALNLQRYKDMFLLRTRHSMVQDLEEHVCMTCLLTFFNICISSLQKQTQGNILTRSLSPMKNVGEKLMKARPPLETRDYLENDLFEFCDQDQIEQ